MTRITPMKLILVVASVIMLTVFLTACNDDSEPQARLPERHVFNPGAVFATNINNDDPRRVLRAAVIFEVADEQASEELITHGDIIRNSVLMVLGELTMEEVTTEKNLEDITERLVDRVNEALGGNFLMPIITGASFTEFVLT